MGKTRRHNICVIFELNLIILRGTLPITPVYCHSPLYTVFSLISSLNFHINYSRARTRAVLHIPSNRIPCIVFVLPYIPVLFYIYPLLHSIIFVLPFFPVPFYISPLLPCIVFVLPYIPVLSYIYPLLPCIVFVLPYIPVYFYISPLLPYSVFVLPQGVSKVRSDFIFT